VTGEHFAYKPHVLQRKFPDYQAPDDGGTGTSIVVRNPKPQTSNPKPETRNPNLENPKPETRNPKPGTGTWNPKPGTRNPKPENRKPKPETRKPKPALPFWYAPFKTGPAGDEKKKENLLYTPSFICQVNF